MTDTQNNNYFSYIRVSDKKQEDGFSLDEQIRRIKEYAKGRNFNIVKEFKEVESAKSDNRPVFKKMIQEAEKTKIKGIIFHKIDRSARNLKDASKLWDMAQHGFVFHFVADGVSTDGPNGKIALIQWGFASFYIENLKEEINKGIMGSLRNGLFPTAAPIGYLDKGKGVKEPEPHQSRLVREAFELYSKGGNSVVELTEIMNKKGLRTKDGFELRKNSLFRILRNSFYYGKIHYRDEYFTGKHKPIIKKALYEKVQRVLDGRGFKMIRRFTYIFSGLIKCPVCGKPLRCISGKGKYKYYNCRDKYCRFGSIREEEVEKLFLPHLKALQFTDNESKMFLNGIKEFRADLKDSREEDLKTVTMQLGQVREQLEGLGVKYAENKMDDRVYSLAQQRLINRELELKEKREALDTADDKTLARMAQLGKLVKNVCLTYKKASAEAKRCLVRSLVENLILEDGNLKIEYKIPFNLVADRHKLLQGGPDGT